MSSTKIEELKLDIEELESLLKLAQRQKSKDLISLEIRRLQTQLVKEKEKCEPEQANAPKPASTTTPRCYLSKIDNYGWGQTDDAVKIYVRNLENVQSLPQESVVCNYTNRSIHLQVLGLNNRNFELLIKNLCEDIIPEKCSYKLKTDHIIVTLVKKQKKEWSHLTEVEKRLKESKNNLGQVDKDEDPGANLMNMMKKMYNDGDDEMKKTIAKAWTESMEKKGQGMMDML